MRVCMLAYSFYETDNRVMRYAETLARRGEEVDIISLRYGNQQPTEQINGVNVLRIQGRAKDERSQWTYLRRLLLFSLRAFILLSRRHLRRRYDFIHVHNIPDFLVFSALVPRITGCPVVLDLHDLLPEFYGHRFKARSSSFLYRLLLWEERLSAAFAHHVIVPNDLWRERVVQRCGGAHKCTVIINAPDSSVFYPRPSKAGSGKFRLFYPGSLNWHQGLDLAIRAAAKVREELPELELTICGLGPERDALRKLISDLNIGDRVFLLEPRPIRDVATMMSDSSLGIVPKRGDSFGNEAFSTKIMEFMATGIPVLVADTKVDRYYFNDNLVQFFRNQDVDDLARSIVFLARHKERREELVRNSLIFVQENNWAVNQHRYLDVIAALTRNASDRTPMPLVVS